jgi:hypothetical protein
VQQLEGVLVRCEKKRREKRRDGEERSFDGDGKIGKNTCEFIWFRFVDLKKWTLLFFQRR